jgi:hypothetical protein
VSIVSKTILRDVSNTLKELIKTKISEVSAVDAITFDSPAEIDSPSSAALSVFLYQITENAHLRNTDPEPVNQNRVRYPPVNVDLYYLFTPYAQNRETELIILESLVQTFHDNSVLSGSLLQGGLAGSTDVAIRVTPNGLSLDELNKLWGMFPNKAFKLSLAYLLSPVRIPSEREQAISRVVERNIGLYSLE